MEQRVSIVTLGVRDLARSLRFYEAMGWQGQEVEETVFFQAGGMAVVLWSRAELAADSRVSDDDAASLWEVAFNPGFPLDEHGSLTVPTLADLS